VEELRRNGATILFVSHDMGMITELCDRAVWLDDGGVCADGEPVSIA
jgi:lipopolysaccharide transport system ATP-binding protein